MNEPVAQHFLDAAGLYCPEPVMLLHGVVRKAAVGEIIHVLATDPSSVRDIPKFCLFLGHDLVDTRTEVDRFEYWICKK
ncbi:MAG: sulfurtransferase TusA [Moraxellaceae bacterium]|jgi:tRNA 2-thiouridine synthesizing protein A|nr:MAG: sulfurtransferase TusA [Moraxellaceae bacterium]